MADLTPMTMHAAVWVGKEDDESVASAMDFKDHLGQIWITFAEGKKPESVTKFREAVMQHVVRQWPETKSLPIMPTGAIPLHEDLILTAAGYRVNPSAESKYQISTNVP